MTARTNRITNRDEVAAEFCRRIGLGQSQAAICAQPDMPSVATVGRWRRTSPDFAARLAAARAGSGRRLPVSLTEPVFAEICQRLAQGEFLTAICRDHRMPCRQHVHERMRADAGLRERYARARELQVEHLFEEILAIADGDDNPVRARLRIETRKWLVARLAPGKFGETAAGAGVDTTILDEGRERTRNAR